MRPTFFVLGLVGCGVFDKQEIPTGEGPEDRSDDTVDSDTDPITEPSEPSEPGEPSEPSEPSEPNQPEDTEDPGYDCEQSFPGYPNASECYTQMLSCGSRVEMSTEGGTFFYDTDQYNSWYAMPTHSQDYSGAERAFYFIHPGGEDGLTRRVDINLQSPCENMDLYYFKTWNEFECYPGECAPCQQDHDLSQNSGNQDDMLSIYDSNDNSYLIIVESRYGFPSPFVLTIDCD